MKKLFLFTLVTMLTCAANAQTIFSEGFENDFASWTLYDNDGDGNQWSIVSTSDNYGIHGGDKCASSASYASTALTPDNWMVTNDPIQIPSSGFTLQWYDATQDPNYPSEHYSVYLSTTGNSVSDFTSTTAVFDITLSSTDWTLRAVDLSSYAGQSVYVAFRHHDCTNMFVIKIDDIEIFKPATAPEIALTSLNIPTVVDVNSSFDIGGVVTNNSGSELSSFKVQYTLNGTTSETITIDGLNVAYGATAAFTHTVPASLSTYGKYTVSVTVSEPNGVADSVGDNTMEAKVAACTTVTEYPFTDGFDSFLGCWSTVDNASIGIAWFVSDGIGIDNSDGVVSLSRNPQYYSALNQDSWLISPALQIPSEGTYVAKWFAKSYMSNYPDSYKVYVSTSNDVATIAASSELATYTPSESDFVEYTQSLESFSGQTVYFAFRHSDCTGYALVLDNFSVSVVPTTPEIILSSLTLPLSVNTGEQFNVSGIVTNNSSVTLNSFKVQYAINGTASDVITIDGLNVAYGETYAFTHSIPATIATAGIHNITVTISEPNGTADNTADNTLTGNIAVCGVITSLPYTESFENGLGCWSASSNNTENDETSANGFGVNSTSMQAHDGNSCFHFSSYTTAADYSQLLISPEFNLPGECQLRFFHKAYSPNYSEKCLVMVSSSDNDPSSFSVISDTIIASTEWTEASATIPANTKYIAIKYVVDDAMWYLGIDNITLYDGSSPATFYTLTVLSDNAIMGTVSGSGSFPENTTTDISATANPGYRFVRWNDNNTEISRSITITSDTTFTAYFEIDSGTQGIDDMSAPDIKLYPNPTSSIIYVEHDHVGKIEVIDAVGRIMMTENNGNTVNIEHLSNGIYSFRIHVNGNSVIKKVVKK